MDPAQGAEVKSKRAVIAESEPSVRGALCVLATQCLGVTVVGEAATRHALQAQVEQLEPDLVVVGWHLVATHAVAAFDALRRAAEELHIVVLGARPDLRSAAMSAGADGYLSKVDAPEVVLRVLRSHLEPKSHRSNEPGGTS
jgi:two-component system, NarL family, response regulator, fimbrial Z protein, FimZ